MVMIMARIAGTFVLLLFAMLGTQSAIGQEDVPPVRDADVVEGIGHCAVQGMETVLFAKVWKCAAYGEGDVLLKNTLQEDNFPKMPGQVDASKACQDPTDKRVLLKHAIKSIVLDSKNKIEPIGIRINGAIFCEKLDLVGLNLPYSLVIDHSIFVKGIEARNFQTKGDLSLDGGLVFGALMVMRSRIGGTIFGDGALIQKAEILDSEVHGSLLLRESVLLEPAIFDTVTIAGELSLRQSDFPYFLLQFSKVGGVLDLSGSQARCAYQLKKNEIGDLVAVDAGFGSSSPPHVQGNNQDSQFD
jgi:hypothetical protein